MTIESLRSLTGAMPFNAMLGIRITRLHTDGVTIECRMTDQLRNLAGALHGGVTATMADAAVGIALTKHFGAKRPITTTELKINYLRPVTDGSVRARSRLLKVGTRLAVGAVEIKNAAGELVAAALVTYMLL